MENPTFGKVLARIIFVLIPTIFCAVVCISAAFTHSLDSWLLPCGIYMAFMAFLVLISVIIYTIAACVNSQAW
nr:MAG TPA: hypothetical protein [Caudoviricetes sp.]